MKRLLVLLSLLFVVACNGANPIAPNGVNPNPTNPDVPNLNVEPTIVVNGDVTGGVQEEIPFPTNIDPLDVRSLDVRTAVNHNFNVSLSFPSTPAGYRFKREIVWTFGDPSQSRYTYGCGTDSTAACERAAKPTKKYSRTGPYTATIRAENCLRQSGVATAEWVCTSQTRNVSVTIS